MIEQGPFGAGLGVIALQLNKPITQPVIKAYHAAFAGETDPGEWAAFCRVAAVRRGWIYLPTVTELFDALEEFRGAVPLQREATAAYEQVMASGEYSGESGTQWTYRRVVDMCGRAAAEAYLAAGGHSAFVTTWDEAKRRERFTAAYTVAARAMPKDRLLPAGATLALPPGDPAPGSRITREEAAKVVERVRAIAGVEAAPPAPKQVVASEERLAELRRQAAAITQDEPAQAGEEGQ